jgi:hypothetical protein
MLEDIVNALSDVIIEAIIAVVLITFSIVIQYFLDLANSLDKDTMSFTLRTALESGKVTLVQGTFNERTDEVRHARRIRGKRLDAKLQEIHHENELAVYS